MCSRDGVPATERQIGSIDTRRIRAGPSTAVPGIHPSNSWSTAAPARADPALDSLLAIIDVLNRRFDRDLVVAGRQQSLDLMPLQHVSMRSSTRSATPIPSPLLELPERLPALAHDPPPSSDRPEYLKTRTLPTTGIVVRRTGITGGT